MSFRDDQSFEVVGNYGVDDTTHDTSSEDNFNNARIPNVLRGLVLTSCLVVRCCCVVMVEPCPLRQIIYHSGWQNQSEDIRWGKLPVNYVGIGLYIHRLIVSCYRDL